jgi:TRAP-type mannitol/chloroaromatic compound transport system permease small subunit
MSALLRVAAVIDATNARIGRWVAWLSLVMVLVGAWNALARYGGRFAGLNLSSNAYIELQWYLFSVLFLLAGASTLREDRHVRVDVLYGRLSDRAKAWIDLVGSVLFLMPFCAFALWVTWPAVAESWRVREISPDPGGLPRYPIKTVILVCFVLLVLQGLSQTVKHLARVLGREVEAPP